MGTVMSGHQSTQNDPAAPRRSRVALDLGGRGVVEVVDAAERAFPDRLIIGTDDRLPVADTRLIPFRSICALRITAATGELLIGTGWLIGPQTLITAGHCVHIRRLGGWAQSIEVIPALARDSRPFGSAVSRRFYSVDGWVSSADKEFDYGAIHLDAPLSDPGFLVAQALPDAALVHAPATLCGYPVDHRPNGHRGDHQYYHAWRIASVGAQTLQYDIDTVGGQSGSPIWCAGDGGTPVVVGIHTTGGVLGNSGTRVTAAVMNNLSAWKKMV